MSHIAIAMSIFNLSVVEELLRNCLKALHEENVSEKQCPIYRVPGAYELPLLTQQLCRTKQYDAIICLGAIIKGETPHFDIIASQTAAGLMKVSLDYHLPVIFGVLTTNTFQEAQVRAEEKSKNKGRDFAKSALQMISVLKKQKKENNS